MIFNISKITVMKQQQNIFYSWVTTHVELYQRLKTTGLQGLCIVSMGRDENGSLFVSNSFHFISIEESQENC